MIPHCVGYRALMLLISAHMQLPFTANLLAPPLPDCLLATIILAASIVDVVRHERAGPVGY